MKEYMRSEQQDEFMAARAQFERLVAELGGAECKRLEHGEVESLIHHQGMDVLRLLLQGYLDARSREEPRQTTVISVDGQERTHCRPGCVRPLMSLFGEVDVSRKGYSGRGQSSVFPLDEALNLPPDKYSHGLRAQVAQAIAQMSFDEAVASIGRSTGGHVPKRQVEEVTVQLAADFSEFYANRKVAAVRGDDLLVLTLDGKGIVMRNEGLRDGTRRAAERGKRKLNTRLCRGEKSNRKRMATVAAVYDVGPHIRTAKAIMSSSVGAAEPSVRPKPCNKRVWASVEQDAPAVINEAFQEALRRDPHKRRRWVVLVDGQETQLRDLYAAAERHGVGITVVQDFVHVLEYLWKAAYCFHPEGSEEAEKWVQERATNVLLGKSSHVAAGMRRSATRKEMTQEKRKPVDKCASYLLKNCERLAYDKALADGLPIATGVIEGACRYLVKDRMDITGARWGLPRAEAVLKLRALRISGDLPDYLEFHLNQERTRNYPVPMKLAA